MNFKKAEKRFHIHVNIVGIYMCKMLKQKKGSLMVLEICQQMLTPKTKKDEYDHD